MSRLQAADLPEPPQYDSKNPSRIFQTALMARLSDPAILDPIVDSLIAQAQRGSIKAIAMVRDSIGEKPAPTRPGPDAHVTVTFGDGAQVIDGQLVYTSAEDSMGYAD